MEKTDRRFKRTNRLLQAALVELTLEKGYEAVSIRDLTERADVGYATFFRHYRDKDDLLEEVLHGMKDEMNTLLKPGWLISNPEQGCTMLFQFVQGNYERVKVLLNSTNTMTLLRPVQELALQEVMEQLPPGFSEMIPADVSAGFLISSLIMMIRWWVENERPYTPERMGVYTAGLVIRPLMGGRTNSENG